MPEKLVAAVARASYEDGTLKLELEADVVTAARWHVLSNQAFIAGGGVGAPVVEITVRATKAKRGKKGSR